MKESLQSADIARPGEPAANRRDRAAADLHSPVGLLRRITAGSGGLRLGELHVFRQDVIEDLAMIAASAVGRDLLTAALAGAGGEEDGNILTIELSAPEIMPGFRIDRLNRLGLLGDRHVGVRIDPKLYRVRPAFVMTPLGAASVPTWLSLARKIAAAMQFRTSAGVDGLEADIGNRIGRQLLGTKFRPLPLRMGRLLFLPELKEQIATSYRPSEFLNWIRLIDSAEENARATLAQALGEFLGAMPLQEIYEWHFRLYPTVIPCNKARTLQAEQAMVKIEAIAASLATGDVVNNQALTQLMHDYGRAYAGFVEATKIGD